MLDGFILNYYFLDLLLYITYWLLLSIGGERCPHSNGPPRAPWGPGPSARPRGRAWPSGGEGEVYIYFFEYICIYICRERQRESLIYKQNITDINTYYKIFLMLDQQGT